MKKKIRTMFFNTTTTENTSVVDEGEDFFEAAAKKKEKKHMLIVKAACNDPNLYLLISRWDVTKYKYKYRCFRYLHFNKYI